MKDVRSEVNSAANDTSQNVSVSPPTPNSGPVEVELEPQHGKKNLPGLVYADGKLTKNDKSYYFDVTGLANVDNMDVDNMNINRPKVFDKFDYGFNVGIKQKAFKKQYNKKKLNGTRDTLDTLKIISFDQHGCFDTRSIKWLEKLTDRYTVNNFLSQISFVFAYGLDSVCYTAELRRLIMISDDSMKNHYQQQLNKLWKIGKVRKGSKNFLYIIISH
jgi:hypothetical protein